MFGRPYRLTIGMRTMDTGVVARLLEQTARAIRVAQQGAEARMSALDMKSSIADNNASSATGDGLVQACGQAQKAQIADVALASGLCMKARKSLTASGLAMK